MRLLGDRCVKCNSRDVITKSKVTAFFLILFILTAGIFIFALPFFPKRCKCLECGHAWRIKK